VAGSNDEDRSQLERDISYAQQASSVARQALATLEGTDGADPEEVRRAAGDALDAAADFSAARQALRVYDQNHPPEVSS
jgi:hypothetical protein